MVGRGVVATSLCALLLACETAREVPPGGGGGATGATSTTEAPTTAAQTTTISTSTSEATSSSGTVGTSGVTSDETTADSTTSDTASGSTTSVPAGCDNGRTDGSETDVDCGGGECSACDFGAACQVDADCETADCDGGSCTVPNPVVWLDGLDAATLFTNNGCSQAQPAAGEEIECWHNKGSAGGEFTEVEGNRGTYEVGGGVALTGDSYSLESVFDGPLSSVVAFVVLEEINVGDALGFNLNHPNGTGDDRYGAQIPAQSIERRLIWDIEGPANRIESPPNVFGFGERHVTGFENSSVTGRRAIWLDGSLLVEDAGASAGEASAVSIGNGADAIIREFRVYAPGLTPAARRVVEGDLACRWELRDLLPSDHPYHSSTAADASGCP